MFYGAVSGMSEFLPISSEAHRILLQQLFGVETPDVVLNFFVHIAALFAVIVSCSGMIDKLRRTERGTKRRNHNNRSRMDARLVKSATLPMLIAAAVVTYTLSDSISLPLLSVLWIINGLIIFYAAHTLQGNKDARLFSRLDSMLLGIANGLSVIPGLSRVGLSISYSTIRGGDRSHAVNWALILSIPFLVLSCVIDIILLFSPVYQVAVTGNVLGYLLAGITAFIGSYFSILLLKFLTVNTGFGAFAYYAWGASLFTFILYLL